MEEILGKGILHSHWIILERLFWQGSLQGNKKNYRLGDNHRYWGWTNIVDEDEEATWLQIARK